MTITLNRQECLFYQELAKNLSDKVASAMTGTNLFCYGEQSDVLSFFRLLKEALMIKKTGIVP
jgi:hypothetical protein